MHAMSAMCPAVSVHGAAHGKIDSQEEHSGATHQGSGEPGLLPAKNTISGQDHFTPALQLLLQLGRFLSLNRHAHNDSSVLDNKTSIECTVIINVYI